MSLILLIANALLSLGATGKYVSPFVSFDELSSLFLLSQCPSGGYPRSSLSGTLRPF